MCSLAMPQSCRDHPRGMGVSRGFPQAEDIVSFNSRSTRLPGKNGLPAGAPLHYFDSMPDNAMQDDRGQRVVWPNPSGTSKQGPRGGSFAIPAEMFRRIAWIVILHHCPCPYHRRHCWRYLCCIVAGIAGIMAPPQEAAQRSAP